MSSEDNQKKIESLEQLISELVEERKNSPVGRINLDRKIERLRGKRDYYKKLEGHERGGEGIWT